MVAGCVRQVVVLYSSNCMGICLGGLSIGRLRRVVVLQRWSFEQVWLYLFVLHQHNFVVKICDLISKERFAKFPEVIGRWTMWHMFLKIVFLTLSAKIENVIFSIANVLFKLLAFFFNADLCIMAFFKVFVTKSLLFPLIIFDFNGVFIQHSEKLIFPFCVICCFR